MAELLSPLGTNSYNGIIFGAKTETVGIDIRPVYDPAGRTVVYNVYTITLKFIVSGQGGDLESMQDDMVEIRRKLTENGRELHYENKGLGDLVINLDDGSVPRDAVWGPKPTLLKWKPTGNIAAECVWTVEVAIPECDNAHYEFGLMEFNFGLTFSIDGSGYTKRTYSGHLRIPQTRAPGTARRVTIDSADLYRDKIMPVCPPGFRRTTQDFQLSPDKCRLDFTIVDEQMPPNIPPRDVVQATARHAASTNKFIASTTLWNGTISASYEVERGKNPLIAIRAFNDLLLERRNIIFRNIAADADADGKRFVLINSFSMEEPEIYGRLTANFSATYTCTMSRAAALVRAGHGLWRPLGNSNWNQWKQSLEGSVFNFRGSAGLKHTPQEDVIIDLCDDTKVKTVSGSMRARPTAKGKLEARTIENQTPPPGSSYLRYRSRIMVQTIDDVVELKTLPTDLSNTRLLPPDPKPAPPPRPTSVRVPPITPIPPGGDFIGRVRSEVAAVPPSLQPPPVQPGLGGGPDVPSSTPSIQTRCRPTVIITLEGSAIRAGYPIVPPTLVSVGRYKAVPANRPGNGFVQEIATSWFGVPIMAASWSLRYLLEGIPEGQLPLPANYLTE